jgi:hypothetical protein
MSDIPEPPEPVATGDRRDQVRFERRANQQLRVRATFPVEGPLPRELTPAVAQEGSPSPDLPTDVAAAPKAPSAWDARPRED